MNFMENINVFIYILFILRCGIAGSNDQPGNRGCFCKLTGPLDDCACHVESVDSFNNNKLFPRLNSLTSTDYFRYWKVNLNKPCPFWSDDSRCALRDCAVDNCDAAEIPDGLRQRERKRNEPLYSRVKHMDGEDANCEEDELGALNTTISAHSKEAFKTWQKFDDAQHNFCELDDENSSDLQWVDLLLNPERFTGYVGASPHRVWRSIYQENCFEPDRLDYLTYGPSSAGDLCLEKRIFYRLISGLHTSINIHLCAQYYFPDRSGFGPGRWDRNVKEFELRFDPDTTGGAGPQRLKNLYFAWLVELRALVKAAPYLEKEDFYTGSAGLDKDVRRAVREVLTVARSFPDQFDETRLFRGERAEAAKLKADFRRQFRNISRIMDCVGCDKCKLWGKLQVTGMGTALKILFSGRDMSPHATLSQDKQHAFPFQLRRQEIISLFNAFSRLSQSVREIEIFKQLLPS